MCIRVLEYPCNILDPSSGIIFLSDRFLHYRNQKTHTLKPLLHRFHYFPPNPLLVRIFSFLGMCAWMWSVTCFWTMWRVRASVGLCKSLGSSAINERLLWHSVWQVTWAGRSATSCHTWNVSTPAGGYHRVQARSTGGRWWALRLAQMRSRGGRWCWARELDFFCLLFPNGGATDSDSVGTATA